MSTPMPTTSFTEPATAQRLARAVVRARTWAMVVLIAANFMDLMDTTVVNVALPTIQTHLTASSGQLQWVVGAYTLGLAAALVTGGRLGDIAGIQRIFIIGISGFTLASLAAATAGAPEWLITARALQGLCAGLMVPQVLAGVQTLYPPSERAPVYALVGLITGSASVVGPLLSGWMISGGAFGLGWRAIFLINVPIGVVLAVIASRTVPDTRSASPPRLDLPGVALLTSGVVCIAIPLIDGRQAGWPWWSWTLLALSPVLLSAFLAWQRASEHAGRTPLIPVHLFRNRAYAAGSVVNFAFQAGLVGIFLVLTLYVQQALGYSPMRSGLVWLGFTVGILAGSIVSGTVANRIGSPLMAVGAVLAAGTVLAVSAMSHPAAGPALQWWQFSSVLAIGGIGMGLLIVPLFEASLATVPVDDAGSASGALSTVQQIGGTLGVAIIGAIFYHQAGIHPTGQSLTSALHASAWGSVIAFGAAALGAFSFRRRSARAEITDSEPPDRRGRNHLPGAAPCPATGEASSRRQGFKEELS